MAAANQACAACKFQRRKCLPDCPLAPYFPPDQPKRFQNVHKVFGVSSVLRILKLVDSSKREETAKSMVFEADTREKDPVHGTYGLVATLESQVSKLKEELQAAREQLYTVKQQHMSMYAQAPKMQGMQYGRTALMNSAHNASNLVMSQYAGLQPSMSRPSMLQQGFQADPGSYRTTYESPGSQPGSYKTGYESSGGPASYDSRFSLESNLSAASHDMNHMQSDQRNQYSKIESRTFGSGSSLDDAQSSMNSDGSSLQISMNSSNNINRDDFLQMQLQISSDPQVNFTSKLQRQTPSPQAHFTSNLGSQQAHFTSMGAQQQQQQQSQQQQSCRAHYSHLDQLSKSHYAQYVAIKAMQDRTMSRPLPPPMAAQQLLG